MTRPDYRKLIKGEIVIDHWVCTASCCPPQKKKNPVGHSTIIESPSSHRSIIPNVVNPTHFDDTLAMPADDFEPVQTNDPVASQEAPEIVPIYNLVPDHSFSDDDE